MELTSLLVITDVLACCKNVSTIQSCILRMIASSELYLNPLNTRIYLWDNIRSWLFNKMALHCNTHVAGWSHKLTPDSKVHGANMGPTWVLSAPGGPHVGPTNLAIRDPIKAICLWCAKKTRIYSASAKLKYHFGNSGILYRYTVGIWKHQVHQ